MDLVDELIKKFNEISNIKIDSSKYSTVDAVISLFMNASQQDCDIKLEHLSKVNEEAKKCFEMIDAEINDWYDQNMVPAFKDANFSKHDVRLKYLSAAYKMADKEWNKKIEAEENLYYDDNVVPISKALDFSLNEFLFEFNGDVEQCCQYIKEMLGTIPDVFTELLSSRIKFSTQDSLSRILEGNNMCSALTMIDKTIYITTNSIHKGSITPDHKSREPSQYYLHLKNVIEYLTNDKNQNINREQIFLNICNQRLRQIEQESKNSLSLSKELELHISKELLKDHHAWRERSPNKTMEMLKESGIKSPLVRHHILSVYSILDRTAHDFKKIGNNFNNFQYKILTLGEKEVHAEMKMLDHLIYNVIFKNNNGLPKTYISISKLCCIDCRNVIDTLNKAVKKLYKMDNFISYGSTSSRKDHGQQFGWQKPQFLCGDIASCSPEAQKICEEFKKLYKSIKKSSKDEEYQSMYPTESDSEDEKELAIVVQKQQKLVLHSNKLGNLSAVKEKTYLEKLVKKNPRGHYEL